MRLSVIIPAYNVANYIEKCIRSIENQDISKSDFEIIVTNDGSPDDCKTIVEKLQNEFSNIVFINQDNQGVSMARNNAIAIAKGNYVLPIDPDDYILPNALGRVLSLAEIKDLDVLYLGYEIFNVQNRSIWKTDYSNKETIIYSGVEGYYQSRYAKVKDHDRSVGILFRKIMLNNYTITYPKNVPYLEDGLFLGKVFTVAEKVGFDSKIFYQRTTRIGSATNSSLFYSETAIHGFLFAVQDIKEFKLKNDFNKSQQDFMNQITVTFVLLSLFPLVNIRNIVIFPKTVQKIKKLGFSKLPIEGVVYPYSKYVKYYNISPYYFLMQYYKEMVLLKINLVLEKKIKIKAKD